MEITTLEYVCPQCKRASYPFGNRPTTVPCTYHVKCINCNFEEDAEWLDSETRKLLVQKKHLGNDLATQQTTSKIEILENKIKALESARDADRTEMQLLRQTIDLLIQNEIKSIKDSVSDHQFNMNNLQGQITKLQETFNKIREHQIKNTKKPEDER